MDIDWQLVTIYSVRKSNSNFHHFQHPKIDEHLSSPPKLEHESEHVVWFHISNTGQPNKFSLKCEATGDPER
ncbi:hypothetical protein T07_5226 [Trichinella nelsoni]|uniref:Uncharacterized protein n=1 Tax=Trichinella nelsoni TaxID=6336 RepID=A0A0V0RN06_9BILA|nr:hypothetical protein T07_5226 [Trichinella nelsoni]